LVTGYSVAAAEEDEVENEDEGAVEDEEQEPTEEQVKRMKCHGSFFASFFK
jgi:hypothetical protein